MKNLVHFLNTFFKKKEKKDFESLYDLDQIVRFWESKMAKNAFRILKAVLTRLCFFEANFV